MSSLSDSKIDFKSRSGPVMVDSVVDGLGFPAEGAGAIFESDPPQPKNANRISPRERANVRLSDEIDMCDSLKEGGGIQ